MKKKPFLSLARHGIVCAVTCLALSGATLLCAGAADIYTRSPYSSSSNGGNGTKSNPYDLLQTAIQNAKDGDTIYITQAESASEGVAAFINGDENGQRPLVIDKSVTIKPDPDTKADYASINNRAAGIILGADVTFENIIFMQTNKYHSAFFANGHHLTLNNVKVTNLRVDLFAGGLYFETSEITSDVRGLALSNVKRGRNNHISIVGGGPWGGVYAGGMNEGLYSRQELETTTQVVYPDSVTIDIKPSGDNARMQIVGIYAGGADEPSYKGGYFNMKDTDLPVAEKNYLDDGFVTKKSTMLFDLTDLPSNTVVDGMDKAKVSYTSTSPYRSSLSLPGVIDLTLKQGHLAAQDLPDQVSSLLLGNNTTLDITDKTTPLKVTNWKAGTGSIIVLPYSSGTAPLELTDSATGTAQLAVGSIFAGASGQIEHLTNPSYILCPADSDAKFTFTPHSSNKDLMLVRKNQTSWDIEENPDQEPVPPGTLTGMRYLSTNLHTTRDELNSMGFEVPLVFENAKSASGLYDSSQYNCEYDSVLSVAVRYQDGTEYQLNLDPAWSNFYSYKNPDKYNIEPLIVTITDDENIIRTADQKDLFLTLVFRSDDPEAIPLGKHTIILKYIGSDSNTVNTLEIPFSVEDTATKTIQTSHLTIQIDNGTNNSMPSLVAEVSDDSDNIITTGMVTFYIDHQQISEPVSIGSTTKKAILPLTEEIYAKYSLGSHIVHAVFSDDSVNYTESQRSHELVRPPLVTVASKPSFAHGQTITPIVTLDDSSINNGLVPIIEYKDVNWQPADANQTNTADAGYTTQLPRSPGTYHTRYRIPASQLSKEIPWTQGPDLTITSSTATLSLQAWVNENQHTMVLVTAQGDGDAPIGKFTLSHDNQSITSTDENKYAERLADGTYQSTEYHIGYAIFDLGNAKTGALVASYVDGMGTYANIPNQAADLAALLPEDVPEDSGNTGDSGSTDTPDSGNTGDSGSTDTPDSGNTGDSGSTTPPDSGNTGDSGSTTPPDSGNTGDSGSTDTPDSGNTGDSGSTDTPDSGNTGDSGSTGTPDSGNTGDSGSTDTPDSGNTGDSGSTTPDSGNTGDGGSTDTPDSGNTGDSGSTTPPDSGNTGDSGSTGTPDSGNTGDSGSTTPPDSGNTGDSGSTTPPDSGNTGDSGSTDTPDSGNTGDSGSTDTPTIDPNIIHFTNISAPAQNTLILAGYSQDGKLLWTKQVKLSNPSDAVYTPDLSDVDSALLQSTVFSKLFVLQSNLSCQTTYQWIKTASAA